MLKNIYFLLCLSLLLSVSPTMATNATIKPSARKNLLAKVQRRDKVIFPARHEKYRVTVFTDINCSYCSQFHRQIQQVNRLGITVEYLAFPNEGLGSSSMKLMQSVWCSPNKPQQLTAAKLYKRFPQKSCRKQQVSRQYLLGMTLGVLGTPTFVLPDGRLYTGYLSPYALKNLLSRYDIGKNARP